MKKSKFSEEQIATALRQVDAGAPIAEVTRTLGISEATYYVWRKRYGQMAIAEIRRLRQLEDENRKLKQLVADLTLELRPGLNIITGETGAGKSILIGALTLVLGERAPTARSSAAGRTVARSRPSSRWANSRLR